MDRIEARNFLDAIQRESRVAMVRSYLCKKTLRPMEEHCVRMAKIALENLAYMFLKDIENETEMSELRGGTGQDCDGGIGEQDERS